MGITFGLMIAVMIYATGHISGAHINPAVTLVAGALLGAFSYEVVRGERPRVGVSHREEGAA